MELHAKGLHKHAHSYEHTNINDGRLMGETMGGRWSRWFCSWKERHLIIYTGCLVCAKEWRESNNNKNKAPLCWNILYIIKLKIPSTELMVRGERKGLQSINRQALWCGDEDEEEQ